MCGNAFEHSIRISLDISTILRLVSMWNKRFRGMGSTWLLRAMATFLWVQSGHGTWIMLSNGSQIFPQAGGQPCYVDHLLADDLRNAAMLPGSIWRQSSLRTRPSVSPQRFFYTGTEYITYFSIHWVTSVMPLLWRHDSRKEKRIARNRSLRFTNCCCAKELTVMIEEALTSGWQWRCQLTSACQRALQCHSIPNVWRTLLSNNQ